MLEKQIQQKIMYFCKLNGILAFKVDSTTTRGFPDLTVILPNGTVLFVELKTPTGKLSPLQKVIHSKIEANNGNIYTIRSVEAFKQLIADQ